MNYKGPNIVIGQLMIAVDIGFKSSHLSIKQDLDLIIGLINR